MFSNIDYQRMRKESLDVLMYDSYPDFGYALDGYNPEDPMKDRWWSRNLAEVRAVSPVFGIMEQQSGANGWNTRMEAPSPRPGQLTLWTMQSIAHGAGGPAPLERRSTGMAFWIIPAGKTGVCRR